MTRLDQHIDAVRTRFLLQKLLNFGAWTLLCAAAVLVVLTLLTKVFAVAIPPKVLLIGGAAVLALFVALVLAIAYSPSREAAAVQIDLALGLKERFSTALVSRGDADPFARAAVQDAEMVAIGVSVHRRFPLKMSRIGYWALGAVVAFAAADRFLPQWDVLGRKETARQAQVLERRRDAAEKALREALAEVMAIPKVGAQEKNLQAARSEIEALLNQEIKDPIEATKTAQNALKEAQNARQKIEDNQRYADAQTQKEAFKAMAGQPGGALEDAKKSLGEGKFEDAAKQLQAAVAQFEKSDADTQQKMAGEMKAMADQLAKMAQDPATQERIRKELEKQGETQEQARQMAQELSRAAAGDKNAQERVRNMAENLARRANGGLLPAPEQLATLMQKLDQMQGQMNSQARSGELAQAVSQLASAMQKQSAQGQQQKSGQGQQGQPGQKQAGGQQQSGQKQGQQAGQSQSGQQNASNQQSQQGQGSQQSGQQQGSQGQSDAQQAMEAATAQLEAMQQAADAAQASGGKQGDGAGEGEGQGWGDAQGQGPQAQGGQGQGEGPSGPNMGGKGSGARPKGVPAPFTVKKEVSPGESNEKGKVIASWLVKADSVKGESKEQFKQIIVSQQHDEAEDVEQNRVPMRAQKAVRDYFQALQDEVPK